MAPTPAPAAPLCATAPGATKKFSVNLDNRICKETRPRATTCPDCTEILSGSYLAPAQCKASCCAEPSCTIWQWKSTSSSERALGHKNCWTGSGYAADLCSADDRWIGEAAVGAPQHVRHCYALNNTAEKVCTCDTGFFGLQCEQQAVAHDATCNEAERNFYIFWLVITCGVSARIVWVAHSQALSRGSNAFLGFLSFPLSVHMLLGAGCLGACVNEGKTQQWAFFIIFLLPLILVCPYASHAQAEGYDKLYRGHVLVILGSLGSIIFGLRGLNLAGFEDAGPVFGGCPSGMIVVDFAALQCRGALFPSFPCMECPGGLDVPCGLGGVEVCHATTDHTQSYDADRERVSEGKCADEVQVSCGLVRQRVCAMSRWPLLPQHVGRPQSVPGRRVLPGGQQHVDGMRGSNGVSAWQRYRSVTDTRANAASVHRRQTRL
jgi:hypothetical protein